MDIVDRLRDRARYWPGDPGRQMLDAADEIEQLRAEREWQPIETAPKEKRIMILENGRTPCIASWATYYSPFYRAEVSGWWTSSDPGRAHVVLPNDATHWQPLPAPPKDK